MLTQKHFFVLSIAMSTDAVFGRNSLAAQFNAPNVQGNAVAVASGDASGASANIDDIEARLRDQRTKLSSFVVTYAQELVGPKSDPNGRTLAKEVTYLMRVAAEGNKRFWSRQTVADQTGLHAGDYTAYFYDGTRCTAYRPQRRYAKVWKSPSDRFLGVTNNWHKSYLESIGLWPFSTPAPQNSLFLPEALNEGKYVVLSESSRVDGSDCVLLASEDRRDLLWLDPAIGYAIRKRTWKSISNSENIERELTILCWDHRNVGDDLWYPYRVVRRLAMSRPGHEKDSTLFTIGSICVMSIRANTQLDVQFEPLLDPGTVIVEEPSERRVFVRGGENVLDEEVARLSPGVQLPERAKDTFHLPYVALAAAETLSIFVLLLALGPSLRFALGIVGLDKA